MLHPCVEILHPSHRSHAHLACNRFCWAMIKIREEIDDIAEGRVAMEQR